MIISTFSKRITSFPQTVKRTDCEPKVVQQQTSASNPFRALTQGYAPINFTARAGEGFKPVQKELKEKLDKSEEIMHKLNNAYPCISPSKIEYTFNKKNITKKQDDWVKDKQYELDNMRKNYTSTRYATMEFIDNLMKSVKENKLANCYEMAKMAQIALQANGVKNISTVNLIGYVNPEWQQQKSLDHTFLVVNGEFENNRNARWDNPKEKYGKNAYVVDPWLGFVDTAENALKIYEKTWAKIPHYNQIKGYGFEKTFSLDMRSSDLKEIEQKYPELILKEPINHKRYDK